MANSADLYDIDFKKVKAGIQIVETIWPIAKSKIIMISVASFLLGVYVGFSVQQSYAASRSHDVYKAMHV